MRVGSPYNDGVCLSQDSLRQSLIEATTQRDLASVDLACLLGLVAAKEESIACSIASTCYTASTQEAVKSVVDCTRRYRET